MKTYCKLLSLTALLLLFLAMPLAASRGRVQGYCQQGNQAVVTPGSQNSTTRVQRSYPACTVNVYAIGTTTHVTLYSDITGTAQANPFTATASAGYWFFYTDSQLVDVALSGAGISTPFTLGSLPAISPTAELSDAPFATLAAACTVATAQSSTLVIGRVWNGLTTASYCQMRMVGGGKLVAAAGAALTMPVPTAPANQQIFDVSASGSAVHFSAPVTEAYPQWFGAKGDGTTNDSLAIQSAISAIAAGGGGTMRVPYSSSPYVASGILMASNIAIQCDSGAAVKMPNGFNGLTTPLFTDGGAVQLTNVHIRGCILDGNRANEVGSVGDGTAVGIYVHGWKDSSIEDNVIQNCWTDGIFVRGYGADGAAQASDGLKITGNTITNSRRNNISLINFKNLTVTGNVITAASGTAPQDGIDIEPETASHIAGPFVIEANTISGNLGFQVAYANAAADLTLNGVIGGNFTGGFAGVVFAGPKKASDVSISGNFSGSSFVGLSMNNLINATVGAYSIDEPINGIIADTGTTAVTIGPGFVSGGTTDFAATFGVAGNIFLGTAAHNTVTLSGSLNKIPNFATILPVTSGGTGDTATAWSVTNPVPTPAAGAITTASSAVRVKTLGKTAYVYVNALVTTAGTGSGFLQIALPFSSASALQNLACLWGSAGTLAQGFMLTAGTSTLSIASSTGGTVISNASQVTCNGTVETQ